MTGDNPNATPPEQLPAAFATAKPESTYDVWPPKPVGVDVSETGPPFRSARALGWFCCALLGLLAAIGAAVAAFDAAAFITGRSEFMDTAASTAQLAVPLLAINGVLFMVWCCLTSRNLTPLGARVRLSVGWILASFLLPPLNLIHPHTILQQIWNGSKTDAPDRWSRWMYPILLGWWLTTLFCGVLSIAAILPRPGMSLSTGWANEEKCFTASGVCFVVSAICLTLIIRRIDIRQLARSKEIDPPAPVAGEKG